ncbi:MAG: hypothetical protein KGL39_37680 [Patescibacteria group bacterium]|nr:hypothetical protein [Patescibacteria group bacterium]
MTTIMKLWKIEMDLSCNYFKRNGDSILFPSGLFIKVDSIVVVGVRERWFSKHELAITCESGESHIIKAKNYHELLEMHSELFVLLGLLKRPLNPSENQTPMADRFSHQ